MTASSTNKSNFMWGRMTIVDVCTRSCRWSTSPPAATLLLICQVVVKRCPCCCYQLTAESIILVLSLMVHLQSGEWTRDRSKVTSPFLSYEWYWIDIPLSILSIEVINSPISILCYSINRSPAWAYSKYHIISRSMKVFNKTQLFKTLINWNIFVIAIYHKLD